MVTMSFYENLVMKTQINFSRYHHVYASGGTPYQLADQNQLSYEERIQRLVQEIKESDCVIPGHIDDLTGWEEALDSGDVTAVLSL